MKFKKMVGLLIVFTLIFSSFPIAQAFADTEMSTNSEMGYMDFVKVIDSSITETDNGWYINDKKFINDYIHQNLEKLQTIKVLRGFQKKIFIITLL